MNAISERHIIELENETYDLVKGEFTPEDALEIVSNLFTQKVNFHEMRSFSQNIRFGCEDPSTKERLAELRKSRDEAITVIKEAMEEGKAIRVNSTLSLEIL